MSHEIPLWRRPGTILLAGVAATAFMIYSHPASETAAPVEPGVSASPSPSEEPSPDSDKPAKSPEAYFAKYHTAAEETEAATGVPKEVVLAMSSHESTYGTSELAVKAHNFFGIKSHSDWQGKIYKKPTHEQVTGAQLATTKDVLEKTKIGPDLYDIKIVAPFRKYDTAEDSFTDYGNYLKNRGFYDDAFDEKDPKKFLARLVDDNGPKYATDRKYKDSVGKRIDTFEDLYKNS